MSPHPGQSLPQATGRRRSGWEGRPGKGGRNEENGVLAPLWEPEAVNLMAFVPRTSLSVCVCVGGSELLSDCADPIFPTTGQSAPWDPPLEPVEGSCLG